jgi:DNA-binding LacI/PurR family transcriptional regulator
MYCANTRHNDRAASRLTGYKDALAKRGIDLTEVSIFSVITLLAMPCRNAILMNAKRVRALSYAATIFCLLTL